MFERFTERARKIMALANEEAQRFNHEFIGTEHILLGLVKEGSGVGAAVLKNLGVDLPTVTADVEKRVKTGPDTVAAGDLPQTPKAQQVMECAIEGARDLGHNYVGSEHLLLGMLAVQDGVAAQVLTDLGVTQDDARNGIRDLLGRGMDANKPIVSPEVDDVIELATDEAAEMNSTHVRSEHLLIALMQHRPGIARKVLMGLGLSVAKIRQEIAKHPPDGRECRNG